MARRKKQVQQVQPPSRSQHHPPVWDHPGQQRWSRQSGRGAEHGSVQHEQRPRLQVPRPAQGGLTWLECPTKSQSICG
jgi:hypothetical protein